MKAKRISILMVSVLAVVLVATMLFVACDPKSTTKDADKYTVTFSLGDGTGGGVLIAPNPSRSRKVKA